MKAKVYTLEGQYEVLVSNKVYSSKENQPKGEFLKEVQKNLELDFDEAIDVVEVTQKQLEKHTDVLIIEAFKNSKGLQEKILAKILADRGIEVEKIEKVKKDKIEKRDAEEMKASDEYKAAKENVGKLATFMPLKSEEVFTGVVKSISLNKTNTLIYFNILCGTSLKCCTSRNASLQFFEF